MGQLHRMLTPPTQQANHHGLNLSSRIFLLIAKSNKQEFSVCILFSVCRPDVNHGLPRVKIL